MRLEPYPRILAYHRVAPVPAPRTPTVTPEAFDRHVRYVTQHFRVVTLCEAAHDWLTTGRWPRRTVVITFDDGDDTTYACAWPILKRHRVPATVFMIAGNVGRTQSLTQDQLRAMAGDGIEIGSHTIHHAYLPHIEPAQARQELITSKAMLSTYVGCPVQTLSYPGGGFSAEAMQAVQDAGYLVACTTNRVLDRASRGVNRWALRRIKMTNHSTRPWVLAAKLSGFYDSFRRLQPSH